MTSLVEKINKQNLPQHVAIIMDGNGRWAKQRGEERVFGHQNGVESVRQVTEAAAELGVKYLTLYAFSTENWNRPKEEVQALMALLVQTVHGEIGTLNKNNVRLQAIGNLELMAESTHIHLQSAIQETATNTGLTLVLALSYSGRWDIVEAAKHIAVQLAGKTIGLQDITDTLFSKHLSTGAIPDPELLIRTSGESRISNFLLWQLAYTELYFTPTLWPDFRKSDFYEAILDFQQRERRFGRTGDQLLNPSYDI